MENALIYLKAYLKADEIKESSEIDKYILHDEMNFKKVNDIITCYKFLQLMQCDRISICNYTQRRYLIGIDTKYANLMIVLK